MKWTDSTAADLDPATVSVAHAQAEQQRQPAPIGQTVPTRWECLADRRRNTAETVDIVNALSDAEVMKDVIRCITHLDTDIVRRALKDTGVTP